MRVYGRQIPKKWCPDIPRSWPLLPYIWNEIKFHVAYGADLAFIAETMERVAAEEIGEGMMERVNVFRELLATTPVDELELRERRAQIVETRLPVAPFQRKLRRCISGF